MKYPCMHCIPPKRYPGCRCPEYLEEKAKDNALKEKERLRRRIIQDIHDIKTHAIRVRPTI